MQLQSPHTTLYRTTRAHTVARSNDKCSCHCAQAIIGSKGLPHPPPNCPFQNHSMRLPIMQLHQIAVMFTTESDKCGKSKECSGQSPEGGHRGRHAYRSMRCQRDKCFHQSSSGDSLLTLALPCTRPQSYPCPPDWQARCCWESQTSKESGTEGTSSKPAKPHSCGVHCGMWQG